MYIFLGTYFNDSELLRFSESHFIIEVITKSNDLK